MSDRLSVTLMYYIEAAKDVIKLFIVYSYSFFKDQGSIAQLQE